MSEIKERLDDFENRLQIIEKAIFSKKVNARKIEENYKGLAGGLRYLINANFFSKPKCLKEIKNELEKENYYYSLPGISSTLSETFMKSQRILTRVGKSHAWKYVIRK
ncbi:MAG: hypothetical protein PHI59_06855 [Candidatus Omnitrophica bacterium]|nr:hypothetical protein [Candidatus Omnitrophota bacterium]